MYFRSDSERCDLMFRCVRSKNDDDLPTRVECRRVLVAFEFFAKRSFLHLHGTSNEVAEGAAMP